MLEACVLNRVRFTEKNILKKQKSHSRELICELDFGVSIDIYPFFLFVSKSIYFYTYIWYDYYGDNMVVSKGRGYVYGIEYHIVFCTKYRKKILTDSVKDSLFQIIILLSQEMDFKIIEINTDLDHIHLLISCKPQHYIPTIVKRLKGTSARLLFKLYPELKKELYGGHMWNPSYFVATVSDTLEENIKEYISNQGK